MERKINKKALLISLIFAIVSCALLYSYIRGLTRPEEEKPFTKMLVAARTINIGEKITFNEIKSIEIPDDFIPADILNDRSQIEGFYAKETILANEPFKKDRLVKEEELSLSYNIPDGKRAITIFVNEETILSNQLRVGDRVDVIGNFSLEQDELPVSKIVLQNVEILSLGSNRTPNTSCQQVETNEDKLPNTVTLCVKPEDAEKVAYISYNASFTFALRGKGDNEFVNTDWTDITDMVPGFFENIEPIE
ncbi:MAG: Flp pilus assembly protein CpaB [Clostridiaceae bacterium]|nr:Flp pilus assembly protein CpaB [Clostridiaceae bacterium]